MQIEKNDKGASVLGTIVAVILIVALIWVVIAVFFSDEEINDAVDDAQQNSQQDESDINLDAPEEVTPELDDGTEPEDQNQTNQ